MINPEQYAQVDQEQIELIRLYKFEHSGDFRDLCDKPVQCAMTGDELAASFGSKSPTPPTQREINTDHLINGAAHEMAIDLAKRYRHPIAKPPTALAGINAFSWSTHRGLGLYQAAITIKKLMDSFTKEERASVFAEIERVARSLADKIIAERQAKQDAYAQPIKVNPIIKPETLAPESAYTVCPDCGFRHSMDTHEIICQEGHHAPLESS